MKTSSSGGKEPAPGISRSITYFGMAPPFTAVYTVKPVDVVEKRPGVEVPAVRTDAGTAWMLSRRALTTLRTFTSPTPRHNRRPGSRFRGWLRFSRL
jgi:hypothetical protein